MLRNYIKIAWRNLLKNKAFSLINIIGLSISMSVCLLIISIISDQKSYDQFHSKKDRIYRVISGGKNGNEMNEMASSALPLGEEIAKKYTGIESAASILSNIGGDLVYNQKIASGAGYFADKKLFEVFDFGLAEGDPKTALENPRSLVVSQEIATQLFKDESPIGKTIKFNHTDLNPTGVDNGNRVKDYGFFTITGILKPQVGKTHLPFKILASLSSVKAMVKDSILVLDAFEWNNIWNSYTYVLLEKGKTKADLQQILNKISDKQFPKGRFNQYAFKAQPLNEITPGDALGNMTHLSIPKIVLFILSILCLIVMLSACLNYTNLSVARSLTRGKEVGIRKVSGATKKQIFGQFITESIVISLISLVFSLLLLLILQNLFSGLIVNKYLNITFNQDFYVYLVFVGFSIGVGLIAGLLPSIYISSFNTLQILKNVGSIKLFKRLTVRKSLMVVQFVVSLIFIISTTLIYLQTDHILNFDYGFNKDNVVTIKLFKTENYDRYAQAISTNKNVLAVSASGFLPATGRQYGCTVHKSDNRKDSLQTNFIDIDAKCLDTWGLKLVAGKNLPDVPSSVGEKYVLINEKMVADFKYLSPAQAIGQKISIDKANIEIVGVVKDFQFLNVDKAMEPLLLRNRSSEFGYISVKISGKNNQETVAELQKTWGKINPNSKFEYDFFDEQILIVHAMLSTVAKILGFISFLAIFISCLGLLGMATYTAETRQKEIGIRKVLGSSIWQIVVLLSKNFMVLIGIAVLIATPIAYLINNLWLNFFASRISISPLVLLSSIFILLIISFLTVFSQSWRAATINPVKSLKTE